MTSFGCSEITMAGFNPSFRIQGQVYHLIGNIIPPEGESPKFSQIGGSRVDQQVDNGWIVLTTNCCYDP